LAHSRDAVALAVGRRPVGVDIEFEVPDALCSYVAATLHPAERRLIREGAQSGRGALLADVWARKEALLKARGSGICSRLDADNTTADVVGWSLCALPAPQGYSASLALPSNRLQSQACD
jgi:4'-phosphopantetheinyl transferase